MNRLGFFLLSFGATLASLGCIFDHQVVTALGLAPILLVTFLVVVFPRRIAYDAAASSRPKGQLERSLWFLYVLVAVLIIGLGFLHIGVNASDTLPAGLLIMLTGILLLCAIYAYNFVDEERVRDWRSIAWRRR